MKVLPKSVEKLIESFEKLPGIGPKTAGRLTFYLLHVPQTQLDTFSEAIKTLRSSTVYCSNCFNIGESDPCIICASRDRDHSLVCVVEQPIDVLSIENTGKYKGVYHVLHGSIDPLNNIGPDEIRISQLMVRLRTGEIQEVILATNPNMEGEATAMYIRNEFGKLKQQNPKLEEVHMSRLAHGLPMGADLEYADEVTLSRALEGRNKF
jgi:recombination protein RecR